MGSRVRNSAGPSPNRFCGSELRPGDRSVDVYVSKLRTKLEAAMPDRRFIHTHPGFGYRFQPQLSRNVHIHAVAD
ncbi:MAG TPA: helix-turn-helix domain-containing protein [Solirubrobacteraceae bacterium]